MGELTKIEWCDYTFNPWIGCQKVSAGCDHCYAENMMDWRFGRVEWGPHGERQRTSAGYWKQPERWARAANGSRPRVFCASLADVFDNKVPNEWRENLFDVIDNTEELDWLLLTKRPENIAKMLPTPWGDGWDNVWLGTTCEDQEAFDRRWKILSETPAHLRFISYEPAIGPLHLPAAWMDPRDVTPDWIICGESGDHARDLRTQCQHYGIPFFMKQMIGKKPIPPDLMIREFPA